jgi:hypothetical protein
MQIETDEWLPVVEAGRMIDMDKKTALALARKLGIAQVFFGVNVMRLDDVKTLSTHRRTPGNPNWIESWEGAAADGAKGTPARIAKRSPRS